MEQRIGVYICWCGTNISKMVDVELVAEEIGKLGNVTISKNYKYMCSDPGQDLIIKDIKEHNLNKVVVAACSPRIHELTFRKALQNAGLNPYMFEMANIREHVSWVHIDRDIATKKAKALVSAAVTRVFHHEELEKRNVDINPATLVIGAGISGITSALEIADAGKKVYLIETENRLGGGLAEVELTFPKMYSVPNILNSLIKKVENHKNIDLFLSSKVKNISGYIGNYEGVLASKTDKELEIEFGNIIVATGLKPFDPTPMDNYSYGKIPDIITSLEFEKMLLSGKIETSDGNIPKNIAIVHCVGSRSEQYNEYCSRTCCSTALKYINQISSALPNSNIYDLYADMRAFGKGCEEFYAETSKKNAMFLMFAKDKLPTIKKTEPEENSSMIIEMDEILSGESIEIAADLVILMVGMESRENAKDIAHLVGISMCGNSFYIEKHPKLDPVATTTDGVYIVGSCNSPKNITDSVAQSKAATARILATILKGSVEIEVTTAVVNEDICCGCQTCICVCPYTAISYDSEKNVSIVNEALCKGCGTCGSACPTGAIKSKHFTDKQILSQIEGLMLEEAL